MFFISKLRFESIYLSILIAGFGGGVVRGLVGFIKHQYSYKNVSFNLAYFSAMMFISSIIGLLTAVAVKELGLTFFGLDYLTPALAFVIGGVYPASFYFVDLINSGIILVRTC